MAVRRALAPCDGAVSPVIGVLLMVAITVAVAALVYVFINNFGDAEPPGENAAASASSPVSGVVQVVLVRGGDHSPYVPTDGAVNEYTITVNGVGCGNALLPGTLSPGGVVRLSANTGSSDCDGQFAAGMQHVSVVVAAAKTTILTTTVDIRS